MRRSTCTGSQPVGMMSGPGRGNRWGLAKIGLAGTLAVLLLVGTGIAYRAATARLQRMHDNPIKLPVPLSAIPMQIDSWIGQESPQETTTEAYMRSNFADEYISRFYVNASQSAAAGVYVVYCASRPAGLLGHRPDVCLPANGWTKESKQPTEITCRSGRKIECLSQWFSIDRPVHERKFVLSFYVLNGQITLHEREFSGFWDRSPNLSGDPAQYVAQVQISSTQEVAARLAAGDLIDTILTFLPDRHGYVRAAAQ